MPQQSISDGSGEEPDLISRFIGQYGKKQTSRAYRTDLQKFESFLKGNLKKKRDSATLEDASRRDVLRFLFEESQSVGQSTVRRRATALKSFFGWLKGKSQRAGRPIGEDENVSELVDSVLEKGPPSEEDRGSAEQDRQGLSEEPTAEKKQTSDEEPTSAEKPTEEEPTGKEELATGHPSSGGPENTNPEEGADPDEKKSPLGEQGSQDEKTGRRDETASEEPPRGEENSQSDTYSSEGPLDIPHWVYDAAEEKADDPSLCAGPHIPLAEVPGALRYGLGELSEWTGDRIGPDYLAIYTGWDLSVQIRYRDTASSTGGLNIVVQIKHQVIERVARRGPDSLHPYHSVPERALWYFRGRRWSMPPVVYKLVDFSHAGDRADKRPTWRSTSPGLTQASYQTTVEVTGALAKAFGLAKDKKVLVSLSP